MDPNGYGRQPTRRSTPSSPDSLDIILESAARSYEHQFRFLESYRARAGNLLAFAAVLVTLSAGTTPVRERSLTQATGTVFVLLAAVLFLVASVGESLQVTPPPHRFAQMGPDSPPEVTKQRLLRGMLEALVSNDRTLVRVRAVLSIGLVCLVLGTVIIGLRVAVLLP